MDLYNLHLQLMQDRAPRHAAADTQEELATRGIIPIFWPLYSLDLNPIKTIWNWMKDYIVSKWGDTQLLYKEL